MYDRGWVLILMALVAVLIGGILVGSTMQKRVMMEERVKDAIDVMLQYEAGDIITSPVLPPSLGKWDATYRALVYGVVIEWNKAKEDNE